MALSEIGLVGLAVMGENLALNMKNHGFGVSVYNRTAERTQHLMAGRGQGLNPTYEIADFVASLARPRRVFLMVQAGAAVDAVIAQLKPFLEAGDIVMDGGNSYYKDTDRRAIDLEGAGLHYFGVGVSGGEAGALEGPCIMPGGTKEAYPLVEPILTAISAKVADGDCCAYMGPRSAGHYVKMVHNGCEYAVMQLIAEAYDILQTATGATAPQLSEIFRTWNEGELNSYLIEITTKVLGYIDPETKGSLVDYILDQAGQKGTGKWTSQDAADLGVPIPNIDSALWGRNVSAFKTERVNASQVLVGPSVGRVPLDGGLVDSVRDALYAGMIVSYAQAMSMLRAASTDYGYDLNFAEIARIWKGGCIIRSELLNPIQAAFTRDRSLANLLVDPEFSSQINRLQTSVRQVITTAVGIGVAVPALSSSLAYFDSYRRARLPVNLIQAQRDFFGAHTYKRTDRPGVFHTEWEALPE